MPPLCAAHDRACVRRVPPSEFYGSSVFRRNIGELTPFSRKAFLASRAGHIKFNKCNFGMPEVIPTYLRERFFIARQGKGTTMDQDRLCNLSRLCGSLGAFAIYALVLAVSV